MAINIFSPRRKFGKFSRNIANFCSGSGHGAASTTAISMHITGKFTAGADAKTDSFGQLFSTQLTLTVGKAISCCGGGSRKTANADSSHWSVLAVEGVLAYLSQREEQGEEKPV